MTSVGQNRKVEYNVMQIDIIIITIQFSNCILVYLFLKMKINKAQNIFVYMLSVEDIVCMYVYYVL